MIKLMLPTLTFALALVMLSCAHATPQSQKQIVAWKPAEGSELIGTKAPEFAGLTWVNCKPLTISALRGKPVFVRFWTGGCSLCEQSMPAINYLHKTYSAKGLVVIGIHHPKGVQSFRTADRVRAAMRQLGLMFPVAIDDDWKTIGKYWVDKDREYTSASILIDRNGIIRWVHPGGVWAIPPSLGGEEQSPAFDSLQRAIEQVLNEKV